MPWDPSYCFRRARGMLDPVESCSTTCAGQGVRVVPNRAVHWGCHRALAVVGWLDSMSFSQGGCIALAHFSPAQLEAPLASPLGPGAPGTHHPSPSPYTHRHHDGISHTPALWCGPQGLSQFAWLWNWTARIWDQCRAWSTQWAQDRAGRRGPSRAFMGLAQLCPPPATGPGSATSKLHNPPCLKSRPRLHSLKEAVSAWHAHIVFWSPLCLLSKGHPPPTKGLAARQQAGKRVPHPNAKPLLQNRGPSNVL